MLRAAFRCDRESPTGKAFVPVKTGSPEAKLDLAPIKVLLTSFPDAAPRNGTSCIRGF